MHNRDSQLPAFHETISRSTYGVDDEKFVFKDQWWMKEKMPLPSLEEQTLICNLLDSARTQIKKNQNTLEKLKQTKRGLMQDLLTGKVRVNELL